MVIFTNMIINRIKLMVIFVDISNNKSTPQTMKMLKNYFKENLEIQVCINTKIQLFCDIVNIPTFRRCMLSPSSGSSSRKTVHTFSCAETVLLQ